MTHQELVTFLGNLVRMEPAEWRPLRGSASQGGLCGASTGRPWWTGPAYGPRQELQSLLDSFSQPHLQEKSGLTGTVSPLQCARLTSLWARLTGFDYSCQSSLPPDLNVMGTRQLQKRHKGELQGAT